MLGRLIDLFDWAIGKCVTRLRILGDGRLVRIKYYLFAATLMAVLLGVLMSRFVAVIPLIMRGLLFSVNLFSWEWHVAGVDRNAADTIA